MNFNSTAFNYALACTKAALFPCMKHQDPRKDSEGTSGTTHSLPGVLHLRQKKHISQHLTGNPGG